MLDPHILAEDLFATTPTLPCNPTTLQVEHLALPSKLRLFTNHIIHNEFDMLFRLPLLAM